MQLWGFETAADNTVVGKAKGYQGMAFGCANGIFATVRADGGDLEAAPANAWGVTERRHRRGRERALP